MIIEKDADGNLIETTEHATERAAELIENYFRAAPKLKAWLQEMKEKATLYGFTESIQGRKRFYDIPPEDHPDYRLIMSQIGRFAGNQPIQASSADMLKDAERRLYLLQRGWDGAAAEPWTAPKIVDSDLLLVCHDEVITDAADAHVDHQQVLLTRAMTDAYNSVYMVKNGQTFWLKDIYNKVDCLVDDYWAKD